LNGQITTELEIAHNLGSTNIIVQFRDTNGKEITLENTIIDENTIKVTSDSTETINFTTRIYKLD